MGAFRQAIGKPNSSSPCVNSEAGSPIPGNGSRGNNDARISALISAVKDNRLRRILEIVESDPSCKIDRLAIECNLSESRLQHLFKQGTGFGLGHLIIERRLLQATDLLLHTNMSIKQIASAIGYGHASSFTRAFERRFQQAPKLYRQAQAQRSRANVTKNP